MHISGETKVIGIIGFPVEHSFSPAMHNAAFRHLGLNYVYVPFPVKPNHVAKAVKGIKGLGLKGVNVTVPHKSAVMQFLDELSPEAELIGAVNTIVNENGILKGYNTDAPGFIKSLELDGRISPGGKRFFITGAGGAARAVSVQLALAGAAEIVFSTPFPEEVKGLKTTIEESSRTVVGEAYWNADEIAEYLGKTDVLVNATPLGMHPNTEHMPPVRLEALPGGAMVCDLIYNPRETQLLREARAKGLPVLNGMGMLLYQGAIAFKLWTGIEPPLEVMRDTLDKVLNNR